VCQKKETIRGTEMKRRDFIKLGDSASGALAATAGLLRHLGSAYIDFKKQIAVGVDGVYVKWFKLEGRQV